MSCSVPHSRAWRDQFTGTSAQSAHPQVTAVAGSAGGLESTPPSNLATAVLTSPNSTDVQHLALGYALDTPEGEVYGRAVV